MIHTHTPFARSAAASCAINKRLISARGHCLIAACWISITRMTGSSWIKWVLMQLTRNARLLFARVPNERTNQPVGRRRRQVFCVSARRAPMPLKGAQNNLKQSYFVHEVQMPQHIVCRVRAMPHCFFFSLDHIFWRAEPKTAGWEIRFGTTRAQSFWLDGDESDWKLTLACEKISRCKLTVVAECNKTSRQAQTLFGAPTAVLRSRRGESICVSSLIDKISLGMSKVAGLINLIRYFPVCQTQKY